MNGIDPQRKKVAVLAIAICTLNMPFMLLMKHASGQQVFPFSGCLLRSGDGGPRVVHDCPAVEI